ncbi:phage major capsid protein [Rhodopseudomonas palustris]|nr:phage major capsid protein [Rhodopseudomonas palustris]
MRRANSTYQREIPFALDVTGRAADRVFPATISTSDVARDGHRILGWDIGNYVRTGAPVLWAHDGSQPPIAKMTNLQAAGGLLRGSIVFPEVGVYDFADLICRMIGADLLRSTSVSWSPIKYKYATGAGRDQGAIDFELAELLETSIVPVPANVDALIDGARSRGFDLEPLASWGAAALDARGKLPMPRPQLEALYRAASGRTVVPINGGTMRTAAARQARASFNSLGENLCAVWRACDGSGDGDRRLVRAPVGLGLGDPSAGGFLVETTYAEELLGFAYEQAVIAPLCDRRTTDKPLADQRLPAIDETSRTDGSRFGGVLSYWIDEGVQGTTSMPKYKQLALSAKKLVIIVVVSNDLLNDVPMLEAHMKRVFAAEAAFQLDRAIISGTGAKPQGVVGHSGTIAVAKETGQAAATIVAENVANMWSRLPVDSRRRAVWVVGEDTETQLESMSYVVGSSAVAAPSSSALYIPTGAAGNPTPLLKGRPVHVLESAPALGQAGDIVLGDFSHYVIRDGGAKTVLSTHVKFLSDEAVFRFTLRIDGQSVFASPITSNGKTRSPFVTLEKR